MSLSSIVSVWLGTFLGVMYVTGSMGFQMYLAIALGMVIASLLLEVCLLISQRKDADLHWGALHDDEQDIG